MEVRYEEPFWQACELGKNVSDICDTLAIILNDFCDFTINRRDPIDEEESDIWDIISKMRDMNDNWDGEFEFFANGDITLDDSSEVSDLVRGTFSDYLNWMDEKIDECYYIDGTSRPAHLDSYEYSSFVPYDYDPAYYMSDDTMVFVEYLDELASGAAELAFQAGRLLDKAA